MSIKYWYNTPSYPIPNGDPIKRIWYETPSGRIYGLHGGLHGDVHPNLIGDVSLLKGDISGVQGDVSGLHGDVTNVWGCMTTLIRNRVSLSNMVGCIQFIGELWTE